MTALVTAYRKRDGAKVQIPKDWLDHPRLGAAYRRTKPSPAQQEQAADTPTPAPPRGGKNQEA